MFHRRRSVCLSVCLSICLSVCRSVCDSLCLVLRMTDQFRREFWRSEPFFFFLSARGKNVSDLDRLFRVQQTRHWWMFGLSEILMFRDVFVQIRKSGAGG